MTAEARAAAFARLREPIDPSQVGKLPKAKKKEAVKGTCKPRSDGGTAPDWQDHFCGQWHGLPAVHLDYAGHAAVTSRLLEVDPEWNWEPKAGWDDSGEPIFIRQGGKPVRLWINLTVLGVTRPGVGTVDPGAFDAEKQLIGDALRNAAMRFGVALDLWIKGSEEEEPKAEPPADAPTHKAIRDAIAMLAEAQADHVKAWWAENRIPPISRADRLSASQADEVLAMLDTLDDAEPEPNQPGAEAVDENNA